MEVRENPQFSRDYLDPQKRSIANALQIFFRDGTATERVVVEYPLGHPTRRAEALPQLREKFRAALLSVYPARKTERVYRLIAEDPALMEMSVDHLLAELAFP
jgi:2-methylcitrate dehydratase